MHKTAAVLSLVMVIFSVTALGQNNPSIYITSSSKTDLPAKPNQASSDADAASHYLQDLIAIELQKQYPCANIAEDRDIGAILKWEHDHSVLDPNYQADLSSVANSLGAKYLISVNVIESGGQLYMQASCMDAKSATSIAKSAKQTNSNNAADDAESLAREFVEGLGPLYAIKPKSGTFPIGTAFSAQHQRFFRGHAHYKSIYPHVATWDESMGMFVGEGGPEGDVYEQCAGENWGMCGGCENCSCYGSCSLKFNQPGRYRINSVTEDLDRPGYQVNVVAEITIAGNCKKQ